MNTPSERNGEEGIEKIGNHKVRILLHILFCPFYFTGLRGRLDY
jgi:hypothetical protein